MGIESLENAARAAGFAMAADEPAMGVEGTGASLDQWRPGSAPLPDDEFQAAKSGATFTEWVKGVVGVNGRSAPA